MDIIKIPLASWMPDLLPFEMPLGGLTICQNLVPYEEYYAIMPSPIPYSSNAMTGTPLIGAEFYSNDGNYYTFIGAKDKLYRMETNKSLSDVSRVSGGAYNCTSTRWYFAKYGDWIIATNYADDVQVLQGMTAANFQALAGSPPKAKYIVENHGHLLLSYLNINGTVYPNTIQFCKYNDIENWGTSGGAEGDIRHTYGAPSPITGMVVVNDVIPIFHRNSIDVGRWTGSQYIFEFEYNKIVNLGAIEGSPIVVNNEVFWFDEVSIYRSDFLGKPLDIGLGVRRRFLNFLNIANYYRISAASNPRFGLVMWSFVSTNSSDDNPDYILTLNIKTNKFSLIENNHYCIFNIHRAAWTYESWGIFYNTYGDVPYPYGSNFWSDNSPLFACVGMDLKVNAFQGAAMDGVFETGEYTKDNLISMTSRLRPIMNKKSGNVILNVGSRYNEDEDVSYSNDISVNSLGYFDVIKAGRYLRFKGRLGYHEGISRIDVEGQVIGQQ